VISITEFLNPKNLEAPPTCPSMLISKKASIHRIIEGTYKDFLIDLATCLGSYLVFFYFLKNHVAVPAIIPTILGTALSFFIGFNNNQAYGRWWEARKIWGALVNDSRSWARQVLHYTQPA
jgi:putative membrane protein